MEEHQELLANTEKMKLWAAKKGQSFEENNKRIEVQAEGNFF